MNVVESPIDTLAFGYVSYGILNIFHNVWTWVAFAAAAVSFWRIRFSGTGAVSVKGEPPASISKFPPKVREIPQIDRSFENPRPRTSVTPLSKADSDFEVNGETKGKFTVYYEDDRERDRRLTGVGRWEDKAIDVLCGEWWESWASVLRTRRAERCWYSYQDLTVINGNVVRLWDGGVREEEYITSCAVW